MLNTFNNIDFGKVRVARNDLEVIAEPVGKAQQRAILDICGEMGQTIHGFDPSELLPFPINDTVVFICFATGDADEDVYEGPCALATIDYPRRNHASQRCVEQYHEFIDSPQEMLEGTGVAVFMHDTMVQEAAFIIKKS